MNEEIKKLQKLAQDEYLELREYSGRFMYGAQCFGITTGDPVGLIEKAANMGITGAKMDEMGCRSIVYWPKIKFDIDLHSHLV